jgi:hypothetical protein
MIKGEGVPSNLGRRQVKKGYTNSSASHRSCKQMLFPNDNISQFFISLPPLRSRDKQINYWQGLSLIYLDFEPMPNPTMNIL